MSKLDKFHKFLLTTLPYSVGSRTIPNSKFKGWYMQGYCTSVYPDGYTVKKNTPPSTQDFSSTILLESLSRAFTWLKEDSTVPVHTVLLASLYAHLLGLTFSKTVVVKDALVKEMLVTKSYENVSNLFKKNVFMLTPETTDKIIEFLVPKKIS